MNTSLRWPARLFDRPGCGIMLYTRIRLVSCPGVDMGTFFDYERLDVYQLARVLNRELAVIIAELPRGAGEAADNLRRAGASITRNVAEANGKWTGPDKAQRYHIARGSAMEVGASLDELVDFGYLAPGRITRAKGLAARTVSMIMGLIRSTRSEAQPAPRKIRKMSPPIREPGTGS